MFPIENKSSSIFGFFYSIFNINNIVFLSESESHIGKSVMIFKSTRSELLHNDSEIERSRITVPSC